MRPVFSRANLNGWLGAPVVMLTVALSAAPAAAHTGERALGGFLAGFSHPIFGYDHLLAMLAVGIWGAQMGGRAVWTLPVTFPLVMALGGILGMAGVPMPAVETGIALSVLALGLAIAFAWKPFEPVALALIAAFAIFHGYAHGAELPFAADPAAYSAGFVIARGSSTSRASASATCSENCSRAGSRAALAARSPLEDSISSGREARWGSFSRAAPGAVVLTIGLILIGVALSHPRSVRSDFEFGFLFPIYRVGHALPLLGLGLAAAQAPLVVFVAAVLGLVLGMPLGAWSETLFLANVSGAGMIDSLFLMPPLSCILAGVLLVAPAAPRSLAIVPTASSVRCSGSTSAERSDHKRGWLRRRSIARRLMAGRRAGAAWPALPAARIYDRDAHLRQLACRHRPDARRVAACPAALLRKRR